MVPGSQIFLSVGRSIAFQMVVVSRHRKTIQRTAHFGTSRRVAPLTGGTEIVYLERGLVSEENGMSLTRLTKVFCNRCVYFVVFGDFSRGGCGQTRFCQCHEPVS